MQELELATNPLRASHTHDWIVFGVGHFSLSKQEVI